MSVSISLLVLFLTMIESETIIPFPSGYSIETINDISTVSFNPEEGFYSSSPDAPFLPLVSKVFLIPGNCEVISSTLTFGDDINETQLDFPLAGAPSIRSIGTEQNTPLRPTAQSLSANSQLLTIHTGHMLSSFSIVSCSVNPWLYDPITQKLSLSSSFNLTLETRNTGQVASLSPKQAEALNFRLNALSREYNTSFPILSGTDSYDGAVDYLIITANEFTDEVVQLEQLTQSRDLTFETITVEDIDGNWLGVDTQEDIRNCIKYYVLNKGTAYVALAGDETVVPARMVYTECVEGEDECIEYAPVDMYYADLDGSWDANNNGIYGEVDDELDLYADVILSRILFSTTEGAVAFFDKNTAYSNTSKSENWYKQVILCGGMLFPDIGYNGAKACEMQLLEYPNNFNFIKSYELTVGDYPDTYFEPLYAGAGWNHYAGHGNERGVYWGDFSGIMTVFRMDGFTNQNQTGIHSAIGCHTGDFTDEIKCLPDTLLTLPDGGGVAGFFNTTWGWEGYWPEIGPSERLCINTVSQTYQQKASSLGLAYTVAKDLEIPMMTGPYDRVMQSILAYTAFMDPALEVLGVSNFNPIPPSPFDIILFNSNPLTDSRILDFKVTGGLTTYDVTVYNIIGRAIVETFKLNQNTRQSIDLSNFSNGVYFVSATASNGTVVSQSFVLLH